MLEIKRQALALEPEEVLELERIITDQDREGAYNFLRKVIYNRLSASQQGRLKCHLDGEADPAQGFKDRNK
jgi:hypothetical protein